MKIWVYSVTQLSALFVVDVWLEGFWRVVSTPCWVGCVSSVQPLYVEIVCFRSVGFFWCCMWGCCWACLELEVLDLEAGRAYKYQYGIIICLRG